MIHKVSLVVYMMYSLFLMVDIFCSWQALPRIFITLTYLDNFFQFRLDHFVFPSRAWKNSSVTCVPESSLCQPTWRDTCSSMPVWDPSSATSVLRPLSRSKPSKHTWLSTSLSNPSNARLVYQGSINITLNQTDEGYWFFTFLPQVCGKSFNRMYNLLGHMHLHAGSKPFKCPYCTSKFNLKGNLSRHMKVKHGIMDTTVDGHGEWLLLLS